ncbi:MAG: RcpC/CpaB family pilus assembly protein [Acidimicrobiia bacterium]|nr:RcpC/CpaB family pilus assembly protein [Acidimicrobiia bacterium]
MTIFSLSLDRRRLLGIGLAIAAMVLVVAATRPAATTDVLVASRDIAAGWPIEPDAFETRAVIDPSGLVEAGTPTEGRWLRAPLAAGEPLVGSLVVDATPSIPPGAMGVEVAVASGVLGDLVPGDRVDVYVTRAGTDPPTRLIATSVPVIRVGDRDGLGGERSLQVLLGVDAATAASIAGAGHTGDLDLVRVAR